MANEIKKAFEVFKKEIAKELNFNDWQKSGFTMSKRQIELRTATYMVNTVPSFEHEIEEIEKRDAKVQGYDTWTDEQKARSHADSIHAIGQYQNLKERYGTKANQLAQTKAEIENSKAFAKLMETLGEITLTTYQTENYYNYIRFNY